MLTIRLQRTGTKNKPAFRIVLAEAHKAVGKKFIEVLGFYNPRNKTFSVKDQERLKYWLAKNVSVSPTVHNLLVEKQIVAGSKLKTWTPKKKKEQETKLDKVKAQNKPPAQAETLTTAEVQEPTPSKEAVPVKAETSETEV